MQNGRIPYRIPDLHYLDHAIYLCIQVVNAPTPVVVLLPSQLPWSADYR